jgi:predicted metal-binding transcription factor (methanogenesis marker protein 9)
MARSKDPFLKKISGGIGKELVIKQYEGSTVVTRYPNMKDRILSPKQIKNNEYMQLANARAKTIMANLDLSEQHRLRLNVTSNKLYAALIKDFFNAVKAGADPDTL